ncbi:zinc metalloproteinase nas-14-like isoform X2 [Paramacrobiotus metropolitanus]|uniref:zinc metalloproteinase nas-14-like isoform X2 n=1 Tax=Paramacrobiotus metropolitanus TaxID=2943436 RepID=UPI0024456416|nr:zinc metalloproteinase nas-14-like isoform X2 [Paramacrobiotus metropolitanus]
MIANIIGICSAATLLISYAKPEELSDLPPEFEEEAAIVNAMVNLSRETGPDCITFYRHRESDQEPYVYFYRGTGCQSYVGVQSASRQDIALHANCLEEIGLIQHEIMHALGFYHEMSRADRDEHITIVWKNVDREQEDNFKQYGGDMQGLPYDYESIMHYHYNAFAKDYSLPTILPKVEKAPIGQRKRMSRLDVERIRKAYQCDSLPTAPKEPLKNDMDNERRDPASIGTLTSPIKPATETPTEAIKSTESRASTVAISATTATSLSTATTSPKKSVFDQFGFFVPWLFTTTFAPIPMSEESGKETACAHCSSTTAAPAPFGSFTFLPFQPFVNPKIPITNFSQQFFPFGAPDIG